MLHGFVGQAALHRQDAQQVQSAGVRAVTRQYSAARRFGFEDPAALMEANRFREQL
jgi:hypothetical protein